MFYLNLLHFLMPFLPRIHPCLSLFFIEQSCFRCLYQSSRQLVLHPPCVPAACQIRNRRGGEMLANIAASDISSPPFPFQMNTQSIQQWINNERCRTTILHGPFWFQPFNASATSWCDDPARSKVTCFEVLCIMHMEMNTDWVCFSPFIVFECAGAKQLMWLVRAGVCGHVFVIDRPVVSVKV